MSILFPILLFGSNNLVLGAIQFDQGDQNKDWGVTGYTPVLGDRAQSFQPVYASVAQVELRFNVSTIVDVTLYLTNTYDGNLPTGGEILGQINGTPSSTGDTEVLFTFTSPISVTPKNTYYLAPYDSSSSVLWYYLSSNPYLNGMMYWSGPQSFHDFHFITYYESGSVSEFMHLFLLILGVAEEGSEKLKKY